MKRITVLSILLCTIFSVVLPAQPPQRFQAEVEQLLAKTSVDGGEAPLILFTGSSSIRFWRSLPEAFPEHRVLNMGFGGSQASDLLHYLDALVLAWQPDQVFIYEGDNDLADGKPVRQVRQDFISLVQRLHEADPGLSIVLIAAKPSPARWQLRREYERLNRRLRRMAKRLDYLDFVDVWQPMLDEKGVPRASIFLEDQLHMNAAGYGIWRAVIRPYLLPAAGTEE